MHSSCMSWHNDMHLAQTTIIYVVLSPKKIFRIKVLFIHMNGYRILPLKKTQKDKHTFGFPPSSYILINQDFSGISGLRHPDPYTKVLTPCFLLHIGVTTPWSLCQGFDTLFLLHIKVTTPWPRHEGFDTLFLLHIGVTTPWSLHHDFYTLFSPTYQGYDTFIPAPRFRHLVSHAHRSYDTLVLVLKFRHLIYLI